MVGLDISSCAVKLIELSQGAQGFRVESYGVEPLPFDAMQEKEIKDVEAVGLAIDRLLKRSRTKSRYGAISVSGSAVITKVIQMNSSLNEQALFTQVQLEAEKHIPYPLPEIYLDYQVLGLSEKDPDQMDVLLAASRSEHVDTRLQALNIGGITTKVVDIEAFAIERALSLCSETLFHGGEHKTIAVLDIGSSMTTLSVLRNKMTVYTREQIFGGKQLTEDIQRHYGLSYAEAGYAKKHGGLPEDYEEKILLPFKEGVVQQVNRALQFFFSSSEYSEIDQIVLAGGTAIIPGLLEMIQAKLEIPAMLANPFSNISISKNVNVSALRADSAAMMICCGLALRSFQ